MRISDWSSDVCSSDLCSRWNLPTGKSVVRICGFGGLIRIETERVERVEALACVVIEIKLAGLAITHCRIKHREPLRRGRLGSTSKMRSEEHTSELQSLMRISYAVFCLKKKKKVEK